ncbi:hypothetical protein OHR68_10225 [Spirillospora sp. NBC_00431]
MAWGPDEHRHGAQAGADLFRHVVTGGELEPMPSVPAGLERDEYAYAELPLEYSRFYATDVTYYRRSVAAYGSAGFVLGALAVNAAGNALARSRARALAAAQWREHQVARVLLTSERLLVFTRIRPLSFWHGGLSEFLPAPDVFQLLLTYPDCEPVQLKGPGVPWLAVAMARVIYEPEELMMIPGFAGMAAWHLTEGTE